MEWLGVRLDPELNRIGTGIITAEDSAVAVIVVAADEEGLIARQTVNVMTRAGAAW